MSYGKSPYFILAGGSVMYQSSDGKTWTVNSSFGGSGVTGAQCVGWLNRYVLLGKVNATNGAYSDDGDTWTPFTCGSGNNFYGLAYNGGFRAISSTSEDYTSPTGATWSLWSNHRTTDTDYAGTQMLASDMANLVCATHAKGGGRHTLWAYVDGVWVSKLEASDADFRWRSMVQRKGRFIAVGGGYNYAGGMVAVSTDNLKTFTFGAVPSTVGYFSSVCWAKDRFVAVGGVMPWALTQAGAVVCYSRDGLNWTQANIPANYISGAIGLHTVCWSPTLNRLVAAGSAGFAPLYSDDLGETWTAGVTSMSTTIECSCPAGIETSWPSQTNPQDVEGYLDIVVDTSGDTDGDGFPVGSETGGDGHGGMPGDAGDDSIPETLFLTLNELGGGWEAHRGLPGRSGLWNPDECRAYLMGEGRLAIVPQWGKALLWPKFVMEFKNLAGQTTKITAIKHLTLEITGDAEELEVNFEVDGEWINTIRKGITPPDYVFGSGGGAPVAYWSADNTVSCFVKPKTQQVKFYAVGRNRGNLTRISFNACGRARFTIHRMILTFCTRNLK